MRYYLLYPEVAGGLGDGTEMDTSVHPPMVTRLHYEFCDWLGDDLVTSFPVFLVTARLGALAVWAQLRGFVLADAETTIAPQAHDARGAQALPEFRWLKATGTPGVDDFGLTGRASLVVSRRALGLLLQHGALNNCEVADYEAAD